ncbi:antigenic cell wall galactomanno [Trichoderma arundinaceum]|uniref:Antigenic cell wall galactomanno n=1 Tax=Trichoderma arundinaceum TaxID=490622 RepID=A0A395NKG2_TRIAR|nr:antigenic cell wall galactomanno [Trichoderma arundinaceum]
MKFHILPLFTLLTSVLAADADPNPILTALNTITTDTVNLNNTVASFNGNPLTLLQITVQSAKLLADINSGTKAANAAANLTFDQTLAVASATLNLATDVNQTITSIIDAKPKFDKLIVVDPVILLNLKLERDATKEFSAAVIAKVPEALQSVAQTLTQGIDDSFAEGLAAYELF